jgi:hypothetical protein
LTDYHYLYAVRVFAHVADVERQRPLQVHSEQPQSVDELRRSNTLETGSLEVNFQDVEFP